MYFSEEINIKDNYPLAASTEYIVFSKTGNQYTFKNKSIYKNQVKICDNIEDGECKECTKYDEQCIECDKEKCSRCLDGYRLNDEGKCSKIDCEQNQVIDENGLCVDSIDYCKENSILNSICLDCESNYSPDNLGKCISNEILLFFIILHFPQSQP